MRDKYPAMTRVGVYFILININIWMVPISIDSLRALFMDFNDYNNLVLVFWEFYSY